jgi:hypothetical protein
MRMGWAKAHCSKIADGRLMRAMRRCFSIKKITLQRKTRTRGSVMNEHGGVTLTTY